MISVALTNYNNSKFLKEVLQSVVMQDYTDWEIIFVDDCSKDKSVDIFKKLVEWNDIEDKVKVYEHPENLGYGASLADAISFSSGELIAVVDSDDALACPEAFSLMVKAHHEHPEASLVYSNYFESRNKLEKKRIVKGSPLKKDETILKKDKKGLSGNKLVVSHLKVFKKKCYDITPGLDRTMRKSVDKDLIFHLEEVGKLVYINETLYIHRVHSNSISWMRRTAAEAKKLEDAKKALYERTWERRNKKQGA